MELAARGARMAMGCDKLLGPDVAEKGALVVLRLFRAEQDAPRLVCGPNKTRSFCAYFALVVLRAGRLGYRLSSRGATCAPQNGLAVHG